MGRHSFLIVICALVFAAGVARADTTTSYTGTLSSPDNSSGTFDSTDSFMVTLDLTSTSNVTLQFTTGVRFGSGVTVADFLANEQGGYAYVHGYLVPN